MDDLATWDDYSKEVEKQLGIKIEIPSYAYQNFCEMYEAYHRLGGNGMVTKMKQEIEELHIKRKGE